MKKLSSIKNIRSTQKTLTAFQTLLINKPAWGQYSASNWSGTTLTDSTGNARHATTSGVSSGTSSGNGATASIAYLSGSTSNTINFPTGSLPSSCTICSLTRQTNSSPPANTGPVLQCIAGGEFIGGFWAGKRGLIYRSGSTFITSQTSVGVALNWLNSCISTSSTTPTNVLTDGVAQGTGVLSLPTNSRLTINNGNWTGNSFEFSQLIIWDQVLTATELATVSTAITTYLSTGVLQ